MSKSPIDRGAKVAKLVLATMREGEYSARHIEIRGRKEGFPVSQTEIKAARRILSNNDLIVYRRGRWWLPEETSEGAPEPMPSPYTLSPDEQSLLAAMEKHGKWQGVFSLSGSTLLTPFKVKELQTSLCEKGELVFHDGRFLLPSWWVAEAV
jgi:hypothetical protein